MLRRQSMRKVIAAIDASPDAARVLEAAGAFARLLAATVEALHVREDGDRIPREYADARHLGLRVMSGPVVESLVKAAEGKDVAALALGTGAGTDGTKPAGHVALGVITSSRKLVLAVPPTGRPLAAVRTVLVPLDGSPETTEALQETIELVRGADLEVVAVHVHDLESLPPFADQPHHEAEAWTEEFLARYSPWHPRKVRCEVCYGPADVSIVEMATSTSSDLVVLAWSQDLSAGRAAVVRAVLARGVAPVLLVPVRTPG